MSSSPKFRVAICGAGIGGLTLALALAPYSDITVDIYEAATRFEEIGAGFALWGRGVAALKKMGMEARLRTIAPGTNEQTIFELRKSNVPTGGHVLGEMVLSRNLGFHRAQFINLLADLLSKSERATTHFSKRLTSFKEHHVEDRIFTNSQGGETAGKDLITLNFTDGSSAVCDVLVGCDGIKSAVRAQLLLGDNASADISNNVYPGTRFSGTVIYRALVKPDDLRAISGEHNAMRVRTMYGGKDKHLVSYPVAGGNFINLLAYCSDPNPTLQAEWEKGPWTVDAEHEEMLDHYRDFEPEAQALLLSAGKSSRWALYDIEPLEFWSRGRVTILGDSAHAMAPFIGAGGGQVIEDVYVLSRLLGSPSATRQTLPSVLRAYDMVRRPRANKVIMCTRESRKILEFHETYDDVKEEAMIKDVNKLVEWLREENGDPDDDVQEAERLLGEFVGEHRQIME